MAVNGNVAILAGEITEAEWAGIAPGFYAAAAAGEWAARADVVARAAKWRKSIYSMSIVAFRRMWVRFAMRHRTAVYAARKRAVNGMGIRLVVVPFRYYWGMMAGEMMLKIVKWRRAARRVSTFYSWCGFDGLNAHGCMAAGHRWPVVVSAMTFLHGHGRVSRG